MAKHILAVDDNPDILEIVGFAFEHEGYIFEATHSQHEMAEALAQCLPDLIVLDLMLPGANGYQVIEQLQHEPCTRGIPVIVITAKAEAMYRRISADLGVAKHLIKPFHPDELVAQVREIFADPPHEIFVAVGS